MTSINQLTDDEKARALAACYWLLLKKAAEHRQNEGQGTTSVFETDSGVGDIVPGKSLNINAEE